MPRFKGRLFTSSVDIATNAGVLINNAASLNPTDYVAVEAYVKPTPGTNVILFDNSQSGVTNSYFVSISATGSIAWFSVIAGVSKNIASTVSKVRLREFSLVSAAYDGSLISIWANGAFVSSLAASGALGTNPQQLRIGQYYSAAVPVGGQITQPRIYHRPYTLTDHQQRYYNNRDDSVIRSDLVLDMPMAEGSGTSVADVSGEGNNGTFSRNVWSTETPFKEKTINVINRVNTENRAATTGRVSTN